MQRSELFCLRHDTRDGDIRRVDYNQLAVASGPTAAAAGPAGTYQLECEATFSATHSDLYCIRMNTKTGEMVLVALPTLETIPAARGVQ